MNVHKSFSEEDILSRVDEYVTKNDMFQNKTSIYHKKECNGTKMMEILCVRLLTTITYHQKAVQQN